MFGEFIGPKRPLSWTFQFWPVLVLSLLCALAATWLVKKIALKFGIVDKPNDTVKTHKEPVAYLGGVGYSGRHHSRDISGDLLSS